MSGVANVIEAPFKMVGNLIGGVGNLLTGGPKTAPTPSPSNSTDEAAKLAEAARKAAQRLAAGTSATLTNSGGEMGLSNVGTTSKALLGQ